MSRRRIILASASASRAEMLAHAGVPVTCEPADIDESLIKMAARGDNLSVDETALRLAEAKATLVSRRHPEATVIGGDQILDCEGRWFDKPADMMAARETLQSLRGRSHDLVTAVSVARRGVSLWHWVERARLTMRPFSDTFLDRYVEACGDDLTTTVGAYRMEGPGVQLFSSIEGDYFTILGLPLLPLLGFLRQIGALPE